MMDSWDTSLRLVNDATPDEMQTAYKVLDDVRELKVAPGYKPQLDNIARHLWSHHYRKVGSGCFRTAYSIPDVPLQYVVKLLAPDHSPGGSGFGKIEDLNFHEFSNIMFLKHYGFESLAPRTIAYIDDPWFAGGFIIQENVSHYRSMFMPTKQTKAWENFIRGLFRQWFRAEYVSFGFDLHDYNLRFLDLGGDYEPIVLDYGWRVEYNKPFDINSVATIVN